MTLLRETLRALPDATFADAFESEDAYLVVLDVPGITEDALTVRGEREHLEITGERDPAAPEGYETVRTERSDTLDVTLPLPPDAHGEAVETALDRGVLELTVPKADDAAETGMGNPESAGRE